MPLVYPNLPSHFTIGIFGAQYHGQIPSEKKDFAIKTFGDLLKASAQYVDEAVHDDSERGAGLSRIWISYWRSPEAYRQWWMSEKTKQFWASLPEDAGFWRETLEFPSTRFLDMVTQDIPIGVAKLGPLSPLTEKSGYWGAYRDRIEEATAENTLASKLDAVPAPRQADGSIRLGRVRMTKFPDNICFVIEGQDHTPLKGNEGKVWSSRFHTTTKRWVTNALRAGPEAGILSSRLCHFPDSGLVNVESAELHDEPDIFPALNVNLKIQIFYFLDMRYMERIGKRDKTHVKLRKDFMNAYGAGEVSPGIMPDGDLLLWVELGILKTNTFEAEYIGCYEGTGFLAYDHHPSFHSTATPNY